MNHPLFRIVSVDCVPPYSLRLRFDDGLTRTVDLEPILEGELFGPLRDPTVFAQVALDPEIHTVVWPCGADFDPATLHDWPEHEPAFRAAAARWRASGVIPAAPAGDSEQARYPLRRTTYTHVDPFVPVAQG